LSDKDFKVKNKLIVNGLSTSSGVVLATNNSLDAHSLLPTQYGGTGTTTSPTTGQIPYSTSGTTYTPTALNTLDVKGASYSADAPSNPVVGQVWVESDSSSDSFDPNIIRRKSFTATAAQTVFTTDLEFIQGYEQVFFNGMLLLRNSDYTTASNTNVTLTSGAEAGDIVEIVSITNLNSINTVATTGANTITATTASTTPLTIQGAASQSAKLLDFKNNSGSSIAYFNPSGSLTNTGLSLSSYGQVACQSSDTGISISGGTGYPNGGTIVFRGNNGGAGGTAANGLEFVAGGTERMRIDSSGNTFIGTSSGPGKLRVNQSGQSTTAHFDNTNASWASDVVTSYSPGGVETSVLGISARSDGSSWLTSSYGALILRTGASNSPSERMRIDSSGNVGIGGASSGAMLYVLQPSSGSSPALFLRQTFDTFAGQVQQNFVNRANTSAYSFIYNYSSGGGDVEQYMRGDGQSYADGSWNGGGADYAEYFEWQDGNPNNEDRRGYSVSLINEKIKIAEEGDSVIGIVSGNPSIVGDDAPMKWTGKYIKDDFNSYVRDEDGYRILNPDYDADAEYISREDRQEWSTIGLMGKIRLRKGQVVGAGWIKMRDISETIEEWLVK